MAKAKAASNLFDPRGARQRLAFAALASAIAWLAIPEHYPLSVRVLAIYSAGAVTLLAIVTWVIFSADATETGRRAAARDPGRTAVWVIVLASTAFSFSGATIAAREASKLSHAGDHWVLVLCILTVAVSWALTHAGFTLRYAHLHYRIVPGEKDKIGGIEFPGGEQPDDLDFAYFAFTIGMCFQVSDATISNRIVRRTVLAHALMSFAYNTVIIALALNLIVGHLG